MKITRAIGVFWHQIDRLIEFKIASTTPITNHLLTLFAVPCGGAVRNHLGAPLTSSNCRFKRQDALGWMGDTHDDYRVFGCDCSGCSDLVGCNGAANPRDVNGG